MILYPVPRVTVAVPSMLPSREAAKSLTEHYYFSQASSAVTNSLTEPVKRTAQEETE